MLGKWSVWMLSLLLVVLAVAACQQPTPVVQMVIEEVRETVEVTVEVTVVVTREVTRASAGPVQEVVVTATPVPPRVGGVFVAAAPVDATLLNPVLSVDSVSATVNRFLYPSLIGQDPFTGVLTPTELARSWEISPDGLVWTFHLRADVLWSDGEPVDGDDVKFTFDAIAGDRVESPLKANAQAIASIETPDPQTVVVTFREVVCDALRELAVGLLPSHKFAADFSDLATNPQNLAPGVSAGPFLFHAWQAGEQISLVRNEGYFKGAPYLDGWTLRIIPDRAERLAALPEGSIDSLALSPAELTAVALDPSLEVHTYRDDGYAFIALNLADPTAPQPGLDESGATVPQTPHPILGDVRVRQAIAHALDVDAIIRKAYLGQGYPLAANVLPSIAWAHNRELTSYAYDPGAAQALLSAAGWVDGDGDGIREREGQALRLALLTNEDNLARIDAAQLAAQQLAAVGFAVQFEAIPFGQLVNQLFNQQFDMALIDWSGLGNDPNDQRLWQRSADAPGSGFNFVSFANDRVEELLAAGVAAPGCDPAQRAPFYKEIQRIIHDELPYIFVAGTVGSIGYSRRWQGIEPGPWAFYWNVEKWSLQE
ncbi:MAG: hypothetical protein HY328_02475 [Chloroflexi bacterium]|nr:hypothetical protein [Chloroflexota bacterium]